MKPKYKPTAETQNYFCVQTRVCVCLSCHLVSLFISNRQWRQSWFYLYLWWNGERSVTKTATTIDRKWRDCDVGTSDTVILLVNGLSKNFVFLNKSHEGWCSEIQKWFWPEGKNTHETMNVKKISKEKGNADGLMSRVSGHHWSVSLCVCVYECICVCDG